MPLSQWWAEQLHASLTGFFWAVEQIPAERQFVSRRVERWSTARIMFHLGWYEQHIALPAMRQWFGEPAPPATAQEDDAALEERDWNDGQGLGIAAMLATLRGLRAEQITLASQASEDLWQQEQPALWGNVSLHWVVTKTYQHTLEHTDEILRQYLWWR